MRKIYTYEECKKIALQYKTRKELKEQNKTVYNKISRNKWCNTLFSHMRRLDGRNKNLSYENCSIIVSNYEFLKDFRKNERPYYAKIMREKWYDLIGKLKHTTDNLYNRHVYVYEFSEYKTAYVGITYSIKNRDKDHHRRGSVFNFTQKNKINSYTPIILMENIPYSECKFYEDFYIKKYKKNGWNLLNKAPAGSLGGKILKKEKIVSFDLNGNYICCENINNISKNLNIPIHLIRKSLRKECKSTMNHIFMLYEEWIKNGSPKTIEKHVLRNKEEKIAILDKELKLLHICETKSESKQYCNITSSCNNIASLRHFLILNIGKNYKCCYYNDYEKYIKGEYILYKPNIPKCKKLVFVPNNITNIEEFTKDKIKPHQWEINRLQKRKKKNKVWEVK